MRPVRNIETVFEYSLWNIRNSCLQVGGVGVWGDLGCRCCGEGERSGMRVDAKWGAGEWTWRAGGRSDGAVLLVV